MINKFASTMQQTLELEANSEPSDVFCNIGSLIVEGRIPSGSHRKSPATTAVVETCYVPFNNGISRHQECSADSTLYKRDENFRRHMLLLWQNNVPVSIELLLCSDCRVGRQKASSIEFSTIPEPGSILVEKWTVSISNARRGPGGCISSRDLLSAIRSYLHFSQLSAWYSNSNGERPKNVRFRITIPGEPFASKFTKEPEEHLFPLASVGQSSSIRVAVKSLPRIDEIPYVRCCHNSSPLEEDKLAIAGSLSWTDNECFSERDLRRYIAKSRLTTGAGNMDVTVCSSSSSSTDRLPSADSMLGDSLLDPPQSIQKIPPKRYQSPSRCGSPSLEAPDHLLFGNSYERQNRQDLDRQKDTYLDLHPKLLHCHHRLSLPPSKNDTRKTESSNLPPLDDRMMVQCTRSGKHICGIEDDDEFHRCTSDVNNVQTTRKSFKEVFLQQDTKKKNNSFEDVLKKDNFQVNVESTMIYRVSTEIPMRERFGGGKDFVKRRICCDEAEEEDEEEEDEDDEDEDEDGEFRCDGSNKTDLVINDDIDYVTLKFKALVVNNNEEDEEEEEEVSERHRRFSDNSSKHDSGIFDQQDFDEGSHLTVKRSVPTNDAKNHFRRSLSSATSMVFHRHTGLPLTSSPAPLRKGRENFDYDSSITTPQDIKRVLFDSQHKNKRVKLTHNPVPVEPSRGKRRTTKTVISSSAPATVTSSNLLCNFEESVLNGRLEPVSTVEGFTAEIGASGSFHPKHMTVPVTVFFYTLCDNSTISSPYLGHINIGKKGYRVPEKGTIQVTLFNPLGTVVKMFVVLYDLSDMPPNSQTFLRQRTLYMPSRVTEEISFEPHKWLRYLIHLRFASSKSGKIYLHTDIRMIIFRKSDLDTATDHSLHGKGFELRSFTRGPNNPKFSPRK